MRTEYDLVDHALRGPLNVAILNLELLTTSVAGDAAGEQAVGKIRAEILRLSQTLLPATFAVLSLELGDLKLLNLRPLVERALAEHGLSGVHLAHGEWPAILGDESLIMLAVAHLARNALTATPAEGRRPEISAVTRPDGGVDLTVRDWGTALVEDRPLVQSYLSRRGHIGGIATVVRVARLHRAGLSFEMLPAGGVVARLSFPPKLH
jgi:two-component system, NtrC family, sensor histidine kinase HydH